MWSGKELSSCFVNPHELAALPKAYIKRALIYFCFAYSYPAVTAFIASIFPFRLDEISYLLWGSCVAMVLIGLYCAFLLLRLDKQYEMVWNHALLGLLLLFTFIFPVAAGVKSLFATTLDVETGEWTRHYFDFPFLFSVYIPIRLLYFAFVFYLFLRPLMLSLCPNYAEVVAKEGKIFMNYWNWDDARKRLPSIGDYDITGRGPGFRWPPHYM